MMLSRRHQEKRGPKYPVQRTHAVTRSFRAYCVILFMCVVVIIARFYMPAINKRTARPWKAEPAFCLGYSSAETHSSIPAAAFELQPGVFLCGLGSIWDLR